MTPFDKQYQLISVFSIEQREVLNCNPDHEIEEILERGSIL